MTPTTDRTNDRLLTLMAHELQLNPHELQPDTRLADIADSLEWAGLLTAVEREFGLHIAPEHGLRLQRVEQLLALVQQLQAVEDGQEPRLVCA